MVEVTYDPAVVTFQQLLKKGQACRIASKIFSRTKEDHARAVKLAGNRAVLSKDPIRVKDDKYYLSRTVLKHVPMTPMQAMLVNAMLVKKKDLNGMLSPRQLELLKKIRANPKAEWPVAIGMDVRAAWTAVAKIRVN